MWIHFSPSTCLWILLVRSIGNIRVLKDYKQIWMVPQAIPLELIMLPCKVYNLQEAGLLRRQARLWRVFHTSYNRQLRHFQVFLSSIKDTLFLIHTQRAHSLVMFISYSSNGLQFKLGLTFITVIKY